jgi:hypothetical protein
MSSHQNSFDDLHLSSSDSELPNYFTTDYSRKEDGDASRLLIDDYAEMIKLIKLAENMKLFPITSKAKPRVVIEGAACPSKANMPPPSRYCRRKKSV